MGNKIVTDFDLTSIANAIRTKGGTSAQLAFPAGFVSAIEAIQTGGAENYTLLDTFSNTEDVSYIDVPLTGYSYNEYALVCSLSLSGSTYIYFNPGGSVSNVIYYTPSVSSYNGYVFITKSPSGMLGNETLPTFYNGFGYASNTVRGGTAREMDSVDYIRVKPYSGSVTISAGGSIALYGR